MDSLSKPDAFSEEETELKEALTKAVKFLDRKVEFAYNPGCGQSVALVSILPKARTILVDQSNDVQHTYVQHNIDHPDRSYEFYRDNMHSFTLPDGLKADLTLILNAGYMTQEELNNVVASSGIVIINDWHGGSTFIKTNCPNYQLLEWIWVILLVMTYTFSKSNHKILRI